MRNWFGKAIIFGVLIALFFVTVPAGHAWQVKVKNGTPDKMAYLTLYYGTSSHTFGDVEILMPNKGANLNAGQEVTFDTGADCPVSIILQVGGPYAEDLLKAYNRCTLGKEFTTEWFSQTGCTHTCWNSYWIIQKHADGAYHLDPN